MPLFDLDQYFIDESGDINQWIDSRGYQSYVLQNLVNYITAAPSRGAVCVLSSGFMTYSTHIHPAYADVRNAISSAPSTFVLLPSLDKETCALETVRRQVRSINIEYYTATRGSQATSTV